MRGSDFLQLDPSGVARGNRADWLAEHIRQAILSGALAPESRLPSTRILAAELGFARGTVTEAYRRLAEEALIASRTGAGSTVSTQAPVLSPSAGGVTSAPRATPGRGDSRCPTPVDLAAGLPDLTAFPRAAWLRAEREILGTANARQLGYAPPAGTPELRHELSAWLTRSRGVLASPERVIVTAGVTGALSLLAQTLRAAGHTQLAVEDPGADGNRRILSYWMPGLSPVPVDVHGIDVAKLAALPGVAAALVTPAHQYPTGVVLSPQRRLELLSWATEEDRLVIEDDYDAEYRYDRRPVRALQSLAPESVAYTASLSKTLAPALRLGWLVPPQRLHARLVELRWATDLGSPALPQLTLAHLLRSGTLERHLRTMRVRHRARRDAAAAAIREHLPGLAIGGIAAGLHLVVHLPETADDERIAIEASAAGVVVQSLSQHRFAPGKPGLVLSYAAHQPAQFNDAIRTLARVIPA